MSETKMIEVIRKCINEYDSEGLLKMGCPTDEYEPEIESIAESIDEKSTQNDVWMIICNTLHWYFRPHDEPVLYWRAHMELADAIVRGIAEESR